MENLDQEVYSLDVEADKVFQDIAGLVPLREEVKTEVEKRSIGRLRDCLLEKVANWSEKDEYSWCGNIANKGMRRGRTASDCDVEMRAAIAYQARYPEDIWAWRNIGFICCNTGKYELALKTLLPSADDQKSRTAWACIALAYSHLGQIEKAREALHILDGLGDEGSPDTNSYRDEAASLIDAASTHPATQAATTPVR